MIFELTEIADRGDLQKERLIIKAKEAGDIGRFAIFSAIKSGEEVLSGKLPNAYWFADQNVKVGDFIVLYTKQGARSEKTASGGSTSYFYYWGLDAPLWSKDSKLRAILVNISTWRSSKHME